MQKIKYALSIIALISILTLTFNVLLVQAAPPSISLVLSGEGDVVVTGYTSKGKEVNFGSYPSPNTIKLTGNMDYVVFTLEPQTDFHVSAVVQDGNYIPFADDKLVDLGDDIYNYTLNLELRQHTVEIIFSEGNTAIVPAGANVSVFLGAGAGVTFANTADGLLEGESEDFPDGSSVIVWELNYTAVFSGGAQIALVYDDTGLTLEQENNLRLYCGESLAALYSDVNGDLIVNGEDVSIVANAVNTNQQPDWYEGWLDINNDGFVDNKDVHVINSYKGTVIEDITDYVDADLNIIYGTTIHFSLFRCR
jgi:hypothetical protein